jgi:hypothetical protein
MKTLLDRADAALKVRREKLKAGLAPASNQGMEGLVDEVNKLNINDARAVAADKANNDGWEEVQAEADDSETAIRVDQYLVVFLKVCVHIPSFPGGKTVLTWPLHSLSRASPLVLSMILRWVYEQWARRLALHFPSIMSTLSNSPFRI